VWRQIIERGDFSIMRWFRVRKWHGVHVALLALLIQFVASFGHVHLGHVEPQTGAAAELILSSSPDGGGTPFNGDSHEPFGSICDICATLNLLASAQITVLPALPVLFALYAAATARPAETAPAELRRVDYRSRAPPAA
jgi:hypothetical protein